MQVSHLSHCFYLVCYCLLGAFDIEQPCSPFRVSSLMRVGSHPIRFLCFCVVSVTKPVPKLTTWVSGRPCPQGEVCHGEQCISCTPCGPGTYKDEVGDGICKLCPNNTFSALGTFHRGSRSSIFVVWHSSIYVADSTSTIITLGDSVSLVFGGLALRIHDAGLCAWF